MRIDVVWLSAVVGLATWLASASPALPQSPSDAADSSQEDTVTRSATGTFDVSLTPQASEDGEGGSLGRMRIEKTYQGDLEGTATGEMLTAMTSVKGSAGYVAVERVTGALHGRHGSFVLQHHGIMDRGAPSLTITVVPDSATGDLTGLAGTLTIDIAADGTHSYGLEYTLPEA